MKWLAPKVREEDIRTEVPIVDPISREIIGIIDENGKNNKNMTQEQYNRAVQINQRIEALKETKNYIKATHKHRLWYAYNDGEFGSDWRLTTEWAMRNISEILDKHDVMIRKEIDEEIEKLTKEIETL